MRKKFNPVNAIHRQRLQEILGATFVLTSSADLEHYGSDETEDLCFPPEVVVRPGNASEVAAVLQYAHAENLPVTPRGAGTGLSGGSLPVLGGICLSTERLNKILEIDLENLVAVVEPGVVTEKFQNAVEAHGLFYPPDPASRGSCFLGGNIAECAGGPRAVKYGVTKDFVLGLEAVLPNGEILRHGGKLFKNVTGFNLSQLLVGSEGLLGIVTKIYLRLLPLPKERVLMLVPFPQLDAAAKCVAAIFRAGIVPSACELMEQDAVLCSEAHLGLKFPAQANQAAGILLIETDGHFADTAMREAERVTELCLEYGAVDVVLADNSEKQKELWRLRRATGEAVKQSSVYREEDTVVPRAQLPALIRGVKEICREFGISSVCYGHAGDGNLHVNILRRNLSQEDWDKKVPYAIIKIFELTIGLGGTISGEHGIGYVQKPYLPLAYSAGELALMSRIKAAFDPNGILNPGKWVEPPEQC